MKYLAILFISASLAAVGQTEESTLRSIEVTGSSEMEITPDEIFIRIALQEYKKGSNKVDLNTLEEGLVKAVKKLGIPSEDLMVQNVSGYNWNWRKRKADDFLGNKSFILKVSDLKKMNDLVDMLDPEGLNNVNVQSYSHSKMEEYRKQVKIGAIKAAKEKATYLLESVGEELGGLLRVVEIENSYQRPAPMYQMSNMALRAESADAYESDVDFMKIKIRAEMQVAFEIGQ